ncbi:hypothetical protein FBZ92_12420 [Nitrospirillum viridazoti]|uniref:Uncharacterized protein n=1 Tax=Nitrospirillum amazonense TaxID=28077 RepID=A0A560HTI3_9PROT|nr:hypothetical protein FBZ92_12420 [Nitrospirillum amazonense]
MRTNGLGGDTLPFGAVPAPLSNGLPLGAYAQGRTSLLA